jgi:mRNA interferase MazF
VKRGEVVTIVLAGADGKPRPALVMQSALFEAHSSVTILPVASELRMAPLIRVTINPSESNGLRKPCQVMIDTAQTVPREKIGKMIGKLEDESLVAINRALAVFLGIA